MKKIDLIMTVITIMLLMVTAKQCSRESEQEQLSKRVQIEHYVPNDSLVGEALNDEEVIIYKD